MTRLCAVIAGLIAALAAPARAADFSSPGAIDSVTVYPDRASVSRRVPLDYAAGSHTLSVAGLPAWAGDDSIRVSAEGSSALTLQNVAVRREELAESADPRVAQLEKRIEETVAALHEIELRSTARGTQIAFLEKLAATQGEAAGRELTAITPAVKPTAQELGRLLDFLYDRRVEAELAVAANGREAAETKKELSRLRRELAGVRGRFKRQTKTVIVDFLARGPGKGVFFVEYLVANAGWSPAYTIRGGAGTEDKVRISYTATVTQRTGEDWNGVKLFLSTATPSSGARAPELEPWIVGERPPVVQPMRDVRGKAAMAMGAAGEQALAEAPAAPQPAEVATAEVKAAGTAVTFNVARRDTVLSGAARTKVTVAELEFAPRKKFLSVPALAPRVFLRAVFANTSDYPLLAGPTAVFLGDNFVGKGSLETIAPGQEVKLDLGVDSGFKIERKLVKEQTGGEGVISRKTVVRHIYEIRLESYKKEAVSVEVKDHLPLSRDKDIVLRDVKLTPEPADRDERNLLTWSVPVNPKENKTIRIEFALEFPPGKRVFGLGR